MNFTYFSYYICFYFQLFEKICLKSQPYGNRNWVKIGPQTNVLTPALHHVSKLLLQKSMAVYLISAPRYSSFRYCDKMLDVNSLMEEEFILDLDSEVLVHLGADGGGGRTVHTQSGSRGRMSTAPASSCFVFYTVSAPAHGMM